MLKLTKRKQFWKKIRLVVFKNHLVFFKKKSNLNILIKTVFVIWSWRNLF